MATGNAIQSAVSGGGAGTGTVTSVTAADTSIVAGGTPGVAITLATGTLDVIAADHPPGANWSNNSKKITGLANGTAVSDAATFGQTIGGGATPAAGGALAGTYPNPSLAVPLPAGVELAAGTTSLIPLLFQSGTLNTTPTAGAGEFDGTALYFTAAASSRQVVDTEQIQILSGTYTLANNTNAQALLNATPNGALTVQGSTTYLFEALIIGTGFSASSHSISFGFGGTATFTSCAWIAPSVGSVGGAGAQWSSVVATASQLTITGTGTGLYAGMRGVMRINAAGTIIPQLTQVTASAAAVIQPGTYFRCWPIGSGSVTVVGDWS